MIKKLDKLILKAFTGPFIVTFLITLFVLMMQILWKYIDDLVGKGLDVITLTKFIIYASATLITLALPIAVLLSSIMTFGKLGENFELVAIKSSGISLLRFMRPLFFIALVLCFITFLFANYVIPVANLKFVTIYNDIYHKSPAFDLKDGVFYNGFKGYSIKVTKKEKDKTTLNSILIYEQSSNPQDNTISSEKGTMKMSTDKKFLEFKLQNGSRYEEKGGISGLNNEFIRLSFKEYNKLFDLSQLEIQLTSDSVYKNNFKMQTLRQLDIGLDSANNYKNRFGKRTRDELAAYFNYNKYKGSIKKINQPNKSETKGTVRTFDDLVPDSLKTIVNQAALNSASGARSLLQVTGIDYENSTGNIRSILVEWHRKFSLSVACLVLLFIGAPLGSIIRRGGLGMPILVALTFFTIFHLLSTFGEKLVRQQTLTPMTGMWLPVMVLLPVGVFLTYKATRDSQILNKEAYYLFLKRITGIFRKKQLST
ncbi:MAG TPA: LptF/LptG family permease [Chitinophagaceae bacterium]|nr:LptF/LptG family permease [Chitinophagaceae bacterium]